TPELADVLRGRGERVGLVDAEIGRQVNGMPGAAEQCRRVSARPSSTRRLFGDDALAGGATARSPSTPGPNVPEGPEPLTGPLAVDQKLRRGPPGHLGLRGAELAADRVL